MPVKAIAKSLADFVKFRILHVDDSPHRIALGVAIGFFCGWTPAIGIQMMMVLVLATLLRANKLVGLPIVWITNPLTAAPVYYFNWLVGRGLTSGILRHDQATRESFIKTVESFGGFGHALGHLFEAEFWQALGAMMIKFGVELWVGSLVIGFLLAGKS